MRQVRLSEAQIIEAKCIEAKCADWAVIYGVHTRLFWAFGAPDGRPITAESAAELLRRMRAAERLLSEAHYKNRPPAWQRTP